MISESGILSPSSESHAICMRTWMLSPGVSSTVRKCSPHSTGESTSVVNEQVRNRIVAPLEGFSSSAEACCQRSGRRRDASHVMASDLRPAGYMATWFHDSSSRLGVLHAADVKPSVPLSSRKSNATSSRVAPAGTFTRTVFMSTGSRVHSSTALPDLITSPATSVLGPVGACSPGIHLGYDSANVPGLTVNCCVTCSRPRGVSRASTFTVKSAASAGNDSSDSSAAARTTRRMAGVSGERQGEAVTTS